ncbi:hypothetical protein A6R68_09517 [Neotoma lepida]|uniref:ADF-H domain-containing protein n=1 Tax=Neotoma lepida TaxID=56216 RepID=A0A1A6FZJ9_NEOLE|nr:hypothetical protein A6R68_09517 [Neotoma lepida]
MASGVAVSDGVIKVFNDMKVRKSSTPEVKKFKAVLFCLSEDKKIILEEGKEILVGDVGQTVDDPYTTFVKMLPDKDCPTLSTMQPMRPRRARRRTWLVFIFWAPESASLKSKMIYASSKGAIKKKLTGIKYELQANCYKEVKDRCTLAEKLDKVTLLSTLKLSVIQKSSHKSNEMEVSGSPDTIQKNKFVLLFTWNHLRK